MKTSNFYVSSTTLLVGVFSSGLFFAGCGSDGGSDRIVDDNLNISREEVEYLYPTANQTGVCLHPTMRIRIKDQGACGMKDFSDVLVLFKKDDGPGVPIALTAAAPDSASNKDVCEFIISPREALFAGTIYGLGVYETPGSLTKTIVPDTIFFTTGNGSGAANCGDGSSLQIQSFDGVKGTMHATNLDSFLSKNEAGDWDLDYEKFLETGATVLREQGLDILGLNITASPSNPRIVIELNKDVDMVNAETNIRLARFQAGQEGAGTKALENFDLTSSGACSGECFSPYEGRKNVIQIGRINNLASGVYVLIITRGLRAKLTREEMGISRVIVFSVS